MTDRQSFTTGNPYEVEIGFSRVVRIGQLVLTAGTVAVDAAGQTHGATCYEQLCYIFRTLSGVLQTAGSDLEHVVRVVCYLTDFNDSGDFSRAFREFLGVTKPAATCIVVSRLFGEGTLAEIELTAVVPEDA